MVVVRWPQNAFDTLEPKSKFIIVCNGHLAEIIAIVNFIVTTSH